MNNDDERDFEEERYNAALLRPVEELMEEARVTYHSEERIVGVEWDTNYEQRYDTAITFIEHAFEGRPDQLDLMAVLANWAAHQVDNRTAHSVFHALVQFVWAAHEYLPQSPSMSDLLDDHELIAQGLRGELI